MEEEIEQRHSSKQNPQEHRSTLSFILRHPAPFSFHSLFSTPESTSPNPGLTSQEVRSPSDPIGQTCQGHQFNRIIGRTSLHVHVDVGSIVRGSGPRAAPLSSPRKNALRAEGFRYSSRLYGWNLVYKAFNLPHCFISVAFPLSMGSSRLVSAALACAKSIFREACLL